MVYNSDTNYCQLLRRKKAVHTVSESCFGTAENYLHVIKHGKTKELALLTLILTKIETKLVTSI